MSRRRPDSSYRWTSRASPWWPAPDIQKEISCRSSGAGDLLQVQRQPLGGGPTQRWIEAGHVAGQHLLRVGHHALAAEAGQHRRGFPGGVVKSTRGAVVIVTPDRPPPPAPHGIADG